MASTIIIGIDLGTTNSEVAIVKDGEVIVLEENGTAIFPSCVGLDPQGQLLVGEAARNQYALRPAATVRSIKREMGAETRIRLADKEYAPQEISAIILKALKDRAEAALGQPVERAVITVPAYFTDVQRQATREAGELAGLTVERLLNEPTAAAFAYELGQDSRTKKTILVYDLGGGTFDVSILRMEGDLVEVLATHGNTRLGGDDIDQAILSKALEAFEQKHPGAKLSETGRIRLQIDCEKLKMALSGQASASIIDMALPLENGQQPVSFEWTVTRREFEEWTSDLFNSTLESVHAALKAAKLSAVNLDEIVLVGGSTRTPYVSEMIEEEFGIRPRGDVHPELAVAYGAGIMAARLGGESHHRILIDITPYTFGIACFGTLANGIYSPDCFSAIIKAGTPLPCSRGKSFFSGYDGQQRVVVKVYQGEHEDVNENVLVGHFEINELDKNAPEGSESFVNMKLDLNGILTVTAIEKHTGFSKTAVMKDTFATPSDDEMQSRKAKVAELFGERAESHVAEDQETNDAEEAIRQIRMRLNRCRDQLDKEDLEEIELALKVFANASGENNEEDADAALETIENILFFAESGK